jgi:hypothetical protein
MAGLLGSRDQILSEHPVGTRYKNLHFVSTSMSVGRSGGIT